MKNTTMRPVLFCFLLLTVQWACQTDTKPAQTHTLDNTTQAPASEATPLRNPPAQAEAAQPGRELFLTFFTKVFVPQLQESKKYKRIHPEAGLFVIHKPSGYPLVSHYKSLEATLEEIPYLQAQLQITASPVAAPPPSFDGNRFLAEGCFYAETSSKKLKERFSEVYANLDLAMPEEQAQTLSALAAYPQMRVVLTAHFSELTFAQIEGRWHLVLIDNACYEPIS